MNRSRNVQKQRGRNPVVQLSLITLMDIFTILLLFLLVHVGIEGVALPSSEDLKLPASTSDTPPRATVNLMVTDQEIFVDGKRIMTVSEALQGKGNVLKPLEEELLRLAEKTRYLASQNASVTFTGKVTVMGDRNIPFRLLKKIMTTCAHAEYPKISLAVIQKEEIG